MYRAHFGFERMPFEAVVRETNYVALDAQQQALESLADGIDRNEDLLVLTGPSGCGKSTLLGRLLPEIAPTIVVQARPDEANASRTLIENCAAALGLTLDPATESSELEIRVRSQLRSIRQAGRRCRLVVDGAEALDGAEFGTLWELAGAAEGRRRSLSLVLVGRSALDETLARDPWSARTEVRRAVVRLAPIDREGCRHYIRSRLLLAGSTTPALFTPSAIDRIHRGSSGDLRLINTLCHRSLVAACEDHEFQVGRRHVARAADATEGITQWKTRPLIGRHRASQDQGKSTPTKWTYPHGQSS